MSLLLNPACTTGASPGIYRLAKCVRVDLSKRVFHCICDQLADAQRRLRNSARLLNCPDATDDTIGIMLQMFIARGVVLHERGRRRFLGLVVRRDRVGRSARSGFHTIHGALRRRRRGAALADVTRRLPATAAITRTRRACIIVGTRGAITQTGPARQFQATRSTAWSWRRQRRRGCRPNSRRWLRCTGRAR